MAKKLNYIFTLWCFNLKFKKKLIMYSENVGCITKTNFEKIKPNV